MNIYESWIVKSPIAHRGLFNAEIPENSLSAFKNSVEKGVAIELDVTALSDGTLVIFHDSKLARMTGKDGFISNCKYEDIKDLTLLKTNEKIPTLKEALETINGQVPVIIEIKNFGKVGSIEKEVLKELQGYKGEYVVSSYNPYTLEWFKNNAPQIKRGQVASFFTNKEITGIRRFNLKRMRLNKKISEPHFIIYSAEDMPNKYTKKYFGKIPVLSYTIKSEEEENRLKEYSDNFVFDSYMPKALVKEEKETIDAVEVKEDNKENKE
ncbi:MAG: glycerophosphodiester phosphodiesterase [Clostridia bacterium]|nr:glycerophosphodiester phosphodiesterase [Clostridia bacterium]